MENNYAEANIVITLQHKDKNPYFTNVDSVAIFSLYKTSDLEKLEER